MNKWNLMLLASASLTANLALADEYNTSESEHRAPVTKGAVYQPVKEVAPSYPFEIILMGGPSTLDVSDPVIAISPFENDTVTQTNSNAWTAGTGQIGLGYNYMWAESIDRHEIAWIPFITPSLNVYYLGGDIKGDIYRFEDPAYFQETFEATLKSTRLMLDLGVTVFSIEGFSIYGLAGLGVAWSNIDFEATANAGFDCLIPMSLDSQNSTSFAYEFGAGVNYEFVENVGISLEYLWARLNDVSLGEVTDYDSGSNSVDISSQSVLLGLRIGF